MSPDTAGHLWDESGPCVACGAQGGAIHYTYLPTFRARLWCADCWPGSYQCLCGGCWMRRFMWRTRRRYQLRLWALGRALDPVALEILDVLIADSGEMLSALDTDELRRMARAAAALAR